MAVLHHTYLIMKMTALGGVLTVRGNLRVSHDCNIEALSLAEEVERHARQHQVVTEAESMNKRDS